MSCGLAGIEGRYFSLPSVVFALAFVLLGWITSYSVAYAIVGILTHSHDHHDQHIHGHVQALKRFRTILVFEKESK